MVSIALAALLALATPVLPCDGCYGPRDAVAHVRNVRRMQPDAKSATTSPKSPLSWGQLNFLHTTDTHGWLEGHIKEQNYGADWGDYKSFVKDMRKKADDLNVDLLVIDTGDLHDGAGLSDATSPNGVQSNPIFENVKCESEILFVLELLQCNGVVRSRCRYITRTTPAKSSHFYTPQIYSVLL